MYKKHHEKFKILDILAVTTQAREGIETFKRFYQRSEYKVTTQAREGIETFKYCDDSLSGTSNNSSPRGH